MAGSVYAFTCDKLCQYMPNWIKRRVWDKSGELDTSIISYAQRSGSLMGLQAIFRGATKFATESAFICMKSQVRHFCHTAIHQYKSQCTQSKTRNDVQQLMHGPILSSDAYNDAISTWQDACKDESIPSCPITLMPIVLPI